MSTLSETRPSRAAIADATSTETVSEPNPDAGVAFDRAQPVSVGRQFAAWLIDFIAAIVVLGGSFVLLNWAIALPGWPLTAFASYVILAIVALIIAWVNGWMVSRFGFTLGCWVMGLRIVDERSRKKLDASGSLIRMLLLSGISLLFMGVGGVIATLTALVDPSGRNRTVHDRAARAEMIDLETLSEETDVAVPTTQAVFDTDVLPTLEIRPLVPAQARPVRVEREPEAREEVVEEATELVEPARAAQEPDERAGDTNGIELARRELERAVAEETARERVAAERAELDRLEVERAEAQRSAAEQAERVAAEQAEVERAEAERAEAERVAAEQAEFERAEAERVAEEQAEAERAEAERVSAAQAEAERAAAEQAELERAEAERRAAEEAELARIEVERRVAEQAELARIEVERRVAEQAELARAEAERRMAEQAELARAESERLAAELARVEAERLAAELARAEAERQAAAARAAAAAERPLVKPAVPATVETDWSDDGWGDDDAAAEDWDDDWDDETPAQAGRPIVIDGRETVLVIGRAVIGRAPGSASTPEEQFISVDDSTKTLSKRHLQLRPDAAAVWVTDLGSTNGSALVTNGKRVPLKANVERFAPQGTTVEFGDHTFVVR